MPKLDIPTQLAVRELLKEAKAFSGISWNDFTAELKEVIPDVEEMSRTKKSKKGELLPKKTISKEFALKLVAYCKAMERFTVSDALTTRLGALWEPTEEVKHPLGDADAGDEKQRRPHSFIGGLGIDESVSSRTIRHFSENYLHFALNESAEIVTTQCWLSNDIGTDEAPIYKSSRYYLDVGIVDSIGIYFCSNKHLYLVASPAHGVDLRMSVFDVLPTSEQRIIRGIALGVTPSNTILSSRCVLIRASFVNEDIRCELWDAPATIKSFKEIDTEFAEIGDYLCGEETLDYIKLMKLEPPR